MAGNCGLAHAGPGTHNRAWLGPRGSGQAQPVILMKTAPTTVWTCLYCGKTWATEDECRAERERILA